uniref:Uncharacterized protein n=1 Tax=Octopus bimaculoides TaxID=37653 RepID=A0A0L8HX04_OCTBM
MRRPTNLGPLQFMLQKCTPSFSILSFKNILLYSPVCVKHTMLSYSERSGYLSHQPLISK